MDIRTKWNNKTMLYMWRKGQNKMTDTQKAIEALDLIYAIDEIPKTLEYEIIRHALKRAEALDKDLANGWAMVPIKLDLLMLNHMEGYCDKKEYGKAYRAAIAAAPQSHISKLGD